MLPIWLVGNKPQQGFSLLELIVVLVLLGLVASIATPNLQRAFVHQEFLSDMRAIINGLRFARSLAMTSHAEVDVMFDLPKHQFQLPGQMRPVALANSTKVTITTDRNLLGARDTAGFRFYPDGSSTGGRVVLQRKGTDAAIDVNWLTGHVSFKQL